MPDETPAEPPATGAPATEDAPTTGAATPADDIPLGEAGQKALEAMKAEAKTLRAEARKVKGLQARIDELESAQLNEVDRAIREAEIKTRQEVTTALRAEQVADKVALAAAGKFADPSDAALLLGDLTRFVTDDGIDHEAIAAEVDALLASKPHLAASTGAPPKMPGVPTGARGVAGAGQLTEADIKTMTPEQIVAAKEAGQFNNLLGIT